MIKTFFENVVDGQLFKFVGDLPGLAYIKLEKDKILGVYNGDYRGGLKNGVSYTDIVDEDFYGLDVVVYDDFNLAGRLEEYFNNVDIIVDHFQPQGV